MRTGMFACLVLVACGGGGTGVTGGDDEPPPPDTGTIDPEARGFQIVTPDVPLGPGDEVSYCYYFRTPNTEALAVRRWSSTMTAGAHHLIVFTTGDKDKMPPGTLSPSNCGFGGSSAGAASWVYSAENATQELALPADDGAGQPVALVIPPNTAGYVKIHFINPSAQAITSHATIKAEALAANASFTATAPYVTHNAVLMVMPGVIDVETQSCDVPTDAKFWSVTTHAHKQLMKAEVLDGSEVVFATSDWEHPGSQTWMTAPFRTFASGKVTYRCTYKNQTNRIIYSGDNSGTDEMCMVAGYYFPATKPMFCWNGNLL